MTNHISVTDVVRTSSPIPYLMPSGRMADKVGTCTIVIPMVVSVKVQVYQDELKHIYVMPVEGVRFIDQLQLVGAVLMAFGL